MNTDIINIDSSQIVSDVNKHGVDEIYGNFKYLVNNNEYYFDPIKNVTSIEISDVTFNYKSAGLIETATNLFNYRLLTINDIERVKYNSNSNGTISYTTKLTSNHKLGVLKPFPSFIDFEQPQDIKSLNFKFYKEDGTSPVGLYDLLGLSAYEDGERFHFTLTIKSIKNSTLKHYDEMFNFSPEILQRLAYTKIINGNNDNNNKNEVKKSQDNVNDENNYKPNKLEPTNYSLLNKSNDTLSGNYTTISNNIQNQQEFLNNGNSINYNYNGFVNK